MDSIKSLFGKTALRLPLLLLAIDASGCAFAQPVLRLTPRSKDVVWVGGTGMVRQETKNMRVAMAFAREENGMPGFRVEVQNLSPDTVVIEPSAFSYIYCNRIPGAADATCGLRLLAVDPESMLLELDMQRSRQKAENANDQSFHATMMLLELTAGLAGAGKGRPNGGIPLATIEGQALNAAADREKLQASGYDLERENWATGSFRKSTLFPDKAAAGLVFIERNLKATEVWFLVQVGGDKLFFGFDQVVYSARSTGD
jgi:hypothetical protein